MRACCLLHCTTTTCVTYMHRPTTSWMEKTRLLFFCVRGEKFEKVSLTLVFPQKIINHLQFASVRACARFVEGCGNNSVIGCSLWLVLSSSSSCNYSVFIFSHTLACNCMILIHM